MLLYYVSECLTCLLRTQCPLAAGMAGCPCVRACVRALLQYIRFRNIFTSLSYTLSLISLTLSLSPSLSLTFLYVCVCTCNGHVGRPYMRSMRLVAF